MKVFNRASLPSKIVYNGKNYFYDSGKTFLHKEHKVFNKKDCILVKVLSTKLKGKTDLHGKKYQPSEWVFNCYHSSNFHLPQFKKRLQNNLSELVPLPSVVFSVYEKEYLDSLGILEPDTIREIVTRGLMNEKIEPC